MKTTQNNIFNECYDNMLKESVLKSVLFGALAGFSVSFLIAFITWFTDFNGLWLALGAFAVVSVSVGILLYFKAFRVNNKKVAERLDRMGLEERMVTMLELQSDDSYIADMQRKNANAAISAASKRAGGSLISVKIATVAIAAVSVLGTLGVGMTAVTALAAYDVIPGGDELFGNAFPSASQFAVIKFIADEGLDFGYDSENNPIYEVEQRVRKGNNVAIVVACNEEGKAFEWWLDEDGTVYRTDRLNPMQIVVDVTRDMTFTAVSYEVPDDEDDPMDSEDPPEPSGGNGQDGNEADSDPSDGDGGDGGNGGGGNGAGSGGTDQFDNIIDGNTDYKEKYDYYYQLAMQKLANGEEIPPELREIIEGYFEILK